MFSPGNQPITPGNQPITPGNQSITPGNNPSHLVTNPSPCNPLQVLSRQQLLPEEDISFQIEFNEALQGKVS